MKNIKIIFIAVVLFIVGFIIGQKLNVNTNTNDQATVMQSKISNQTNNSVQKVACNYSSKPHLNITTPNGGENYQVTYMLSVLWNGCDPTFTGQFVITQIDLIDTLAGTKWAVVGPMASIPTTLNNSYSFTIPIVAPGLGVIDGNNYKISVNIYDTYNKKTYNDQSDAVFSILLDPNN